MQQPYRVYIAAASTPGEIERAKRCAALLGAAGIAVTSTWTSMVTAVGAGNPRDADPGQRREWSRADLAEVAVSDALWLLCPPGGVITRGAWVELGYAWDRSLFIVSSGDTTQSIFTALGIESVSDEDAASALVVAARRRVTP